MTEQIPGPSSIPVLGNMPDVQSQEGYLKATERLADIYSPIYQTMFQGQQLIHVSSASLVTELSDDKKWITIPLEELSRGEEAKGMFNAPQVHAEWYQARRFLWPSLAHWPLNLCLKVRIPVNP